MEGNTESPRGRGFRLPFWLGLVALLAILGFFFWQEHRVHVFDATIVLLLLACPLLHVFMHRGHGGHGRRGSGDGGRLHEHGSSPGDPT